MIGVVKISLCTQIDYNHHTPVLVELCNVIVVVFFKEPEFFSKCEFCGTEEQASRFKRSKRFCTMACAKRYNRAHRTSVFKTRGKGSKSKLFILLYSEKDF